MLEDDYMIMTITTILYAIHKRASMDELEKFEDHGKQSSTSFHFMAVYAEHLPVYDAHYPSIDWNARPNVGDRNIRTSRPLP